ncbi:uncharacterized protein LOC132314264 [Cornus florida]|uniref:uncharacterized protein LOC132314264 n=1 Tax=Cornus florida TaxID=4283 RepID=UPI0028983FF8|nr:uncharacterized protein LOC132314264 [Cornus florida]
MDDRLLHQVGGFTLTEDEDITINITDDDLTKGIKWCKKSLVGKLLKETGVNVGGLRDTLGKLWVYSSLKVLKLSENIYQFLFQEETVLQQVLLTGPWHFNNRLLILIQWRPNLVISDDLFRMVDFWVHPSNLLLEGINECVSRKIAASFLHTYAVEIRENVKDGGRFLRLRVTVDFTRPLRRGTSGRSSIPSFSASDLELSCPAISSCKSTGAQSSSFHDVSHDEGSPLPFVFQPSTSVSPVISTVHLPPKVLSPEYASSSRDPVSPLTVLDRGKWANVEAPFPVVPQWASQQFIFVNESNLNQIQFKFHKTVIQSQNIKLLIVYIITY